MAAAGEIDRASGACPTPQVGLLGGGAEGEHAGGEVDVEISRAPDVQGGLAGLRDGAQDIDVEASGARPRNGACRTFQAIGEGREGGVLNRSGGGVLLPRGHAAIGVALP